MNPVRHLYFHIPFCAKLCPYCSFYVDTHFKNKSQRFLDALLSEVDAMRARFEIRPRTIYFGGGTPSSLSLSQLAHLLDGLRERLDSSDLSEWTFEVNPATVSQDKARLLRDLGVNRVSMGVQSWDDAILRSLGRIHTGAQALETLDILRGAGFENINLDLMFSVPGQTREQWRETLEKTITLHPGHISSYCLTYEEDTEFFRKLQTGEMAQDENLDADLFEMTMDTLGEAGYAQYEISNYALPGRESRHNCAYWNGEDYLGFGPGAFSTHGSKRWQNIPDSAAYTEQTMTGKSTVSFEEQISEQTRLGERIAFSLRTGQGVEAPVLLPWRREMDEFFTLGLLRAEGDRVTLTRRGKMLADSVAEIFV
jgi:oxygen-independent coproporphyrinogen-3 oxidase